MLGVNVSALLKNKNKNCSCGHHRLSRYKLLLFGVVYSCYRLYVSTLLGYLFDNDVFLHSPYWLVHRAQVNEIFSLIKK